MKTLSIVIPVYNEEKRLDITFYHLSKRFLPRGLKLQSMIFVNDGSCDATLRLLRKQKDVLSRKLRAEIVILSYKKNQGKGYAVRLGMNYSEADYTLFLDADMSTPLTELVKCESHIKSGAEVIIGTRKNGHSTVTVHQPLLREKLGRVFTYFAQFILHVGVTDFTCGFKLFRKDVKEAVFSRALINRWGYDAEVLYLTDILGYKIQEVALLWAHDTGTKVHVLQDGISSFSELLLTRWFAFTGSYRINRKVSFPNVQTQLS